MILGDFSEEELKKAYKRQSKKWHPDRNGGSNEVFQLVSLAYETLRDRARRALIVTVYPLIVTVYPLLVTVYPLNDRARRAAYDAGEDVERGTKHDGSEGSPHSEKVERLVSGAALGIPLKCAI